MVQRQSQSLEKNGMNLLKSSPQRIWNMPLEDAPFYGPKWSKYPKKYVKQPMVSMVSPWFRGSDMWSLTTIKCQSCWRLSRMLAPYLPSLWPRCLAKNSRCVRVIVIICYTWWYMIWYMSIVKLDPKTDPRVGKYSEGRAYWMDLFYFSCWVAHFYL